MEFYSFLGTAIEHQSNLYMSTERSNDKQADIHPLRMGIVFRLGFCASCCYGIPSAFFGQTS